MVEFYLGKVITKTSMKYSHGTPTQIRASIMIVLFFALPAYSILSLYRQGSALPFGFLLLVVFGGYSSLRVFLLSLFEEFSISESGVTRHVFGKEQYKINWQEIELIRLFTDGTTQIFYNNVVRPMHIYNNEAFKNEIRAQKNPDVKLIEYEKTPVD